MVAINDGDGWVDVTRPEITDIALGGNETEFPGKFFRELASRDKFVYDQTAANSASIATNASDITTNSNDITTLTTRISLIPGRNKIINGNFDIWQRGTSFSLSEYTADRWYKSNVGSSGSLITRQDFTLGQTDVPGNPSYYLRSVVTSGGTASSAVVIQQRIEGVRTFQGQTVTVSFWAKADSTKPVSIEFEQHFGTGGAPSAVVDSIEVNKFTLTSSWAKYTATVSIPSISGKTLGSNNNDFLAFKIWFEAGSDFNSRTDSLGLQSGTFDVAKVQIELGSTATTFEELPLSTQLQLCQRYFGNNGGSGYFLYSTTDSHTLSTSITLPTQMRTIPTISVITNSTFNFTLGALFATGPTCIAIWGSPITTGIVQISYNVSVDAEL